MDIRKIIQEEIIKVFEGGSIGSSYYANYPDFLDPQFNPQIGAYPPVGFTNYGDVMKEERLDEDYPEMFKMDEFKTLTTFKERIRYCESFLQRISSGSARIVYKIDDKKVLKLAKNKKGLVQNELEISHSNQRSMIGDIIAKVFDYDENNLWSEMELARKIKKADFKKIIGYSWEEYVAAVHNYGIDSDKQLNRGHKYELDNKVWEEMWEDEFMYEIFQYIGNYNLPTGDLERLSTYGVVNRSDGEEIVIIDYGLNKDNYNSYYS